VFDAEYGVQIIVVLDDHAGAQLGCRDRHRLNQSPSNKCGFADGRACPEQAKRAEGRAGHIFRRTRGPNSRFYTPCRRKKTFP